MSLLSGIYKYVWPEIRKYKPTFFLIMITFGFRVLLESIFKPLYFKKIIDVISMNNINTVSSHELYVLVAIIISMSIGVLITARVGKYLHFTFEIKVIKNLRDLCFSKITNNSQSFFSDTFSGSLVTKSKRFVGSFEYMFDVFVYDFLSIFITLVGIFIVVFNQSKSLSMFFVIWVLFYVSIIIFFVRKKIKYDLIEAAADSKISGYMADVFGNILATKIFSARKKEISEFDLATKDAADKSSTTWNYFLRIEIVQSTLVVVVQGTLLYLLITMWIKGQITTGTVVLVQTYTVFLFERLWNLGNSLTRFMKAAADMKEMIDIFETTQDVKDPVDPEQLAMDRGHLVFKDVCFKYKNNEEIFTNFNLDIKPGERIGLVGHSGAGKSTFVNLVLRFSDVDSGSITIDGQDVSNVTQDDLRSVISYVPQESVLFHRTIRENIAYGKPDATDEEIISSAEKARAHMFIEKFSNKYDTYVGERGVKLSGGERQRVAIARALVKNSPIFILDEATSALDSISEQYIQEAFNEIMKDKTTIVIAHRLSTIQKMDRIIVLEEGKIAEEGSHSELLEKNGQYADLWNHQVGGFIE